MESLPPSFHDDLTKLPNLRLFKEKLTEIVQLQTDKKAAIFVLDIDRFKNINEAFGHSFGDLILQGIASRLTEQIEHNMFLSKLPGDEFAIILSSAMDEDEIITVVERIQNCLKEPLQAQQMLLNPWSVGSIQNTDGSPQPSSSPLPKKPG